MMSLSYLSYAKQNQVHYLFRIIFRTSYLDQEERFIVNRFVNIQCSKNNNIAHNEYIEMLNRTTMPHVLYTRQKTAY